MKLSKPLAALTVIGFSLIAGQPAFAEPLVALTMDPVDAAPSTQGLLPSSLSLIASGFGGFLFACRGMARNTRAKL
ncbi:MAG: hypothetical protein AAGC77_10000 [Pseudomonadota bacterium]